VFMDLALQDILSRLRSIIFPACNHIVPGYYACVDTLRVVKVTFLGAVRVL
jgi:hypothetical protein